MAFLQGLKDLKDGTGFETEAQDFINENQGNAVQALSRAFKFISTLKPSQAESKQIKSLLTQTINMQTMIMQANSGKGLSEKGVRAIIDRGWKGPLSEAVQVIKGVKGNGAAFDLPKDYVERFIEVYQHLKEQEGSMIDFQVCRLEQLPEMLDPSLSSG